MNAAALATKVNDTIARVEAGEATHDEALTLLHNATAFAQAAREIKATADAALIAWMTQHGDLDAGTVRYYVGRDKTEKVISAADTLKALFDHALNDRRGDLDEAIKHVAAMLTSDPFKPGACGTVIDRAKNFAVTEREVVKDGVAKPVRKIKSTREEQ
jgi:hypothetical protein